MATNSVSGELKELSLVDYLTLFDVSVHAQIVKSLELPGTEGVICFENLDMCAGEFGKRTSGVFGPGRTYTSLDVAAANFLHSESASRRQYPVAYAFRPPIFVKEEKVSG